MIKPEEAEEREESRSLNEYWMEDTEVVSTCVMAMAMVIFGEKEALNHCFLHNVYNRNSCRCRHQYQMEVNWIRGTQRKAILTNNFPVVEEDTKEDAFYRLLDFKYR